MSSWLTFVVGIIFGLLIGWVIDLLYRRRQASRELEPAEPGTPPPAWAAPLPDVPVETGAPPVDAYALAETETPELPAPSVEPIAIEPSEEVNPPSELPEPPVEPETGQTGDEPFASDRNP